MGKRTQKIRLKRNRSKRNLSKRNNTKRSNIRKKARFMRGGMRGTDNTTGFSVASNEAFANMPLYDETDEMDPRERRRNARNMERVAAEKRKKEKSQKKKDETSQLLNQHLNEKMVVASTIANMERAEEMSATMKQEIIKIINSIPYETLQSIHRFAVSKNEDYKRQVSFEAHE